MLILQLGTFEEARRQAQEVEAGIAKARTELSTLQIEIESLRREKDALTPTIVDWEKRVKDKAAAEAVLATLEGKKRQIESDISQAGKSLDEVELNLESAQKQRAELSSEIEKLRTEVLSLTKTKTDAKALLDLAAEAERRLNDAQNALTNADARRKQVETDANQLQKEVDDARKLQDKLNTDAAMLRQQIQTLKDEIATSQSQSSELQARQAAVQQEEQKLTKLQQQVTSAETRFNELNEQEERQRRAQSESSELTNRLEQARKDVADWEFRRDAAKADFQKADSDLSATRKLLQEVSAKHDELIRESSGLVTAIDRLTKEKETKEKELGQLDAEPPASPKADQ